ncbi:S-adenosyl-L-methionine-dependent methyltransferase [Delphinella strobiligena]|nr:S-adenosyl-L-methionine-dependent methyltransferase [Delphinella strobiligena]
MGMERCLRHPASQLSPDSLIRKLSKTYSIYGPLLLLPQHAVQSAMWTTLSKGLDAARYEALLKSISKHMKVSHIAINAPIPLHSDETDNIVRSPTNLSPLFGDFGPMCNSETPTESDFEAAFWCHTKQNGIMQFWAPRYTMFSRGNITEKARVLLMPSVATAVSYAPDTGCCAVDLYCGIGYFTFSYLAAGVKTVLGWDLNPWSIEGLRRGAMANKWSVDVYSRDTSTAEISVIDEKRLIAFNESNELALARIKKLRDKLPPIRHINCGLLPTSQGSYATAAAALDPKLGGWMHVHENFAAADINDNAENIRQTFEQLMQRLDEDRGIYSQSETPSRRVLVEHVQRVKSYAPGVFHCVVDFFISPPTSSK